MSEFKQDLDTVILELSRHNFHHVNDADPLKSHSQEYCRVMLGLIAGFQEEIEQLKRPRPDDSDILREWGAFRRAIRQLLHEQGVRSNPGWTEHDILDALRKMVKSRPVAEIETHLAVVCAEAQQLKKDHDEIYELNQTQADLLHKKNNRMVELSKCIALATDALIEIRDSIKWGEDTAIKREISSFQKLADQTLKEIAPFRWYPEGEPPLPMHVCAKVPEGKGLLLAHGQKCPYCGVRP